MTKILFFGEPLIRITPNNYQNISDEAPSTMYFGGSEINIARTLSGFDIPTKIITGVPNNEIGNKFIRFLKSNAIDTSSIQLTGNRIGLYYLENGYGTRNSKVYYDRLNTSINDISNIDYNTLFQDISHFHFSGITVAISKEVQKVLLSLLEEAKKRNIVISMDLNFRSKMISIEEAKNKFSQFVKYANICFGIDPILCNSQDIMMFDRDNATATSVEQRMRILQKKYKFDAIFHTSRKTMSDQTNRYKAFALINDNFVSSIVLETGVLERVGSGDAFVAGSLYGILNNSSPQQLIDFGVACAIYKCTCPGDSMFTPIDPIQSIMTYNQEINR